MIHWGNIMNIHQDDWEAMTWKDRFLATRDDYCYQQSVDAQTETFVSEWQKDDDTLRDFIIEADLLNEIRSIIKRVGEKGAVSADEVAISEKILNAIRTAARAKAEAMK